MSLKHEVALTNLDKIFWKKEKYTKGDLIKYYYSVADSILPHLKDRPMVLNRHPNGIEGESFFQKQIIPSQTPDFVKTVKVQHTHKITEYLMVQDLETLLYVANLGCIELNPFLCRRKHLLNPSYTVIDLDPENVPFDVVVEIALSINEILKSLLIKAYCKTSGGRGLHIYIPIGAQYDFKQSQKFAYLLAVIVQEKYPKIISLVRSPSKRQKKIYIDYLRNSPSQTLAAAYCIRPKKHAPVSTPLDWKELKPGLNPIDFNIETVPQRVREKGDIFSPVIDSKGINLEKVLALIEQKYV